MRTFICFIALYGLVYSFNLIHQLDLNFLYADVYNMDIKVIRYSRDQLLKIKDTSQRTDNFNWSHIDSILHPPSKHKGNRIPTMINNRLSDNNQRQYRCQQKSYTNLVQLPSLSSATNHQSSRANVTLPYSTGSMSVNGNAGGVCNARPWSDPHYGYGTWPSAQCSVNQMSTNSMLHLYITQTVAR